MEEVFDEDLGAFRKRTLSNSQVAAFVMSYWARRKGLLGVTVVCTLAAVCLDLAAPWTARALVDAVAGSRPSGSASGPWSAWLVFVLVSVGYAVARNIAFATWNALAARNMEEITREAFARVQTYSAEWHANNFAGATVRRVSRAMWGYDQASDAIALWIGPALLVLIGMGISIAVRWPLVGAFTLGLVALYIAANIGLVRIYVRPANLRSIRFDSLIGGALADALGSNAAVKAFGGEERERRRFDAIAADWRRATYDTWTRFLHVWALQNGILILLQAGLSGLIVWLWYQGRASPGDVAFAIAAYLVMAGYLRTVGENVRMLQKGLDDAEDVAGYLRTPPEVTDRPGAPDFTPGAGEIRFEAVDFRYPGQAEPLYRQVSLVIAAGERTALVGATGSGKSTFVRLIQRLYDLESGRIRVDGQDIAAVRQASLRRAIALVPQDPALFHRTIAENIAYGRPDASRDEIARAARLAKADAFIERLPNGYDTLVGERGVKLSGGERQRVAIARAFLVDAPILILDEATSSLDVETEREVQAACEALMRGRTTIIIAHRLSTVRRADRILVFAGGRIVEEGCHADLLARDGTYARMNRIADEAA